MIILSLKVQVINSLKFLGLIIFEVSTLYSRKLEAIKQVKILGYLICMLIVLGLIGYVLDNKDLIRNIVFGNLHR